MELQDLMSTLGEAVTRRATAESVFGTPLSVGGVVYLPVARVQYGLGGGCSAENVGGGGGMSAGPAGVVEIGPAGVVFHEFPGYTGEGAVPEIVEVSPGVHQLSRPGEGSLRCWLLEHGGEGALVDAPPDASLSWFAAEQARLRGVSVGRILLTHAHYKHCGGLQVFRRLFPGAVITAHRSVVDDPGFPPSPGPDDPEAWRTWEPQDEVGVHEVFDEPTWTGALGGEPLWALYAPRHSWTDHLLVFRGCLLSGDWPLDGSPGAVPPEAVIRVLEDLRRTLSGPYVVHTVVPAHSSPVRGLDSRAFTNLLFGESPETY